MNSTSKQRKPRWAAEMSGVLIALAQSRRTLRQAARASGDRRMSSRFRRLARRRRAAAEELKRAAPTPTAEDLAVDADAILLAGQVQTANEISATAACLRANRRLRAAIESALDAEPPPPVVRRLEALGKQADLDAGIYNARLRELIVVAVPVDPTTPSYGKT